MPTTLAPNTGSQSNNAAQPLRKTSGDSVPGNVRPVLVIPEARKQLPDGEYFEQTPQEHAEDCALFQAKTYTKCVKDSLFDWADKHTRLGANKVLKYLIEDCVGWYPDRPDYLRCIVKMKTIADLTGLDRRQVIRIIQSLQRRGLLLRRKRKMQREDGTWRQRANSYTLLPGQVLIAKEVKKARLEQNVTPVLEQNVTRIPESDNDQKTQLECKPSSIEGAKKQKRKTWNELNKDSYEKLNTNDRKAVNKVINTWMERCVDSDTRRVKRINWDSQRGSRCEGWVFTVLLRNPRLFEDMVRERMRKIPEGVNRAPYRQLILGVAKRLKTMYAAEKDRYERINDVDANDPVRSMDPTEIQAEINARLAAA